MITPASPDHNGITEYADIWGDELWMDPWWLLTLPRILRYPNGRLVSATRGEGNVAYRLRLLPEGIPDVMARFFV